VSLVTSSASAIASLIGWSCSVTPDLPAALNKMHHLLPKA
jgi:hypothetical protein